ncbi:GGDEF domain-containing protein [Rugosimonospora africana]|uniref:GGDEF domain-containing protein n=1 Tax=Rugosimonospora africana TaxID=556532 RepID=A0A8J3VS97_9ACTN|nr:GGDEF domain-containing protein [Rugosimonospora africana]GIH16346.1 hypothetical protein Raf01_45180 [Rugosimonospora africana]
MSIFSSRGDSLVPPWSLRRALATAGLSGALVVVGLYLHTPPLVLAGPGVFMAAVIHNTSRMHRWQQQIYAVALREAHRDPLTGLPTRRAIDHLLDEITRTGGPITVALADIDGLHTVNTNLGHAGGDRYLTEVARRLASAVAGAATLARMGGDEFAVVAEGTDASGLATALGAALAASATIAGARIQPRASIGVATSGNGTAWHALACADAAMYTAKEAGGNRVLVYDPDRDGVPALDGTRPPVRRRDVNPTRGTGAAWVPTGPGDPIPVMVTSDELRLLHEAVTEARMRGDQRATQAQTAADQPPAAPADEPAAPRLMDIRSMLAGRRAMAARLRADGDRYARLADRLTLVLATVSDADSGTGIRPVGVVLRGIAAAFTADELDALVVTAAQAVCADLNVLSDRQRHLAYRAYRLLSDTDRH